MSQRYIPIRPDFRIDPVKIEVIFRLSSLLLEEYIKEYLKDFQKKLKLIFGVKFEIISSIDTYTLLFRSSKKTFVGFKFPTKIFIQLNYCSCDYEDPRYVQGRAPPIMYNYFLDITDKFIYDIWSNQKIIVVDKISKDLKKNIFDDFNFKHFRTQ
jgi:hypothetical protein